jgi:molybdopterin synthase catalytic subunit
LKKVSICFRESCRFQIVLNETIFHGCATPSIPTAMFRTNAFILLPFMFWKENVMDLAAMISSIKANPNCKMAGMIVCHNGIVRGTSRDGRLVKELEVTADKARLNDIVSEMKKKRGIVDILAEVYEGRLKVGDDIMCVAVAGDIRENTFSVLADTVNAIKRFVVVEREI